MSVWQWFLVGAVAGGVTHFTLTVLVPMAWRRVHRWWHVG